REATNEDLTKMKYLEYVIKETLRLFPSVPLFVRELDEDVKIEGVNFVAGTAVLLAPIIMHKHPQYFPNPEKFDPERFTPENVRGRHPYAYVPFSAGPRNCIGQKFAMMEMKAAVSKILRNYKLSSGGRENVYSVEMILRTVGGTHIKLENRK
ncbi:Cytochrome P450 4c3, partial [Gryllus bimaculatus]